MFSRVETRSPPVKRLDVGPSIFHLQAVAYRRVATHKSVWKMTLDVDDELALHFPRVVFGES